MKEFFNNIIDKQATNETGAHCPICKRFVPAMRFLVDEPNLKIDRWVQPKCHCENDITKQGIVRAAAQKQKREKEKYCPPLPKRYQTCGFRNFEPTKETIDAFEIAKQYAKDFKAGANPTGFFFFGTPGTGKTHLAAAIVRTIEETTNKNVYFYKTPELLERIRSTFGKGNDEHELMKRVKACDLLILDDFGAEKATDWVAEQFFKIIDYRYSNDLPIIITSNLNPNELKDRFDERIKGERIMDRVLSMCTPLEITGTSYRQKTRGDRAVRV